MENNEQDISIGQKAGTQDYLVSVVTPVFNGMKYLNFCINSVLNQSYLNIEHIFVDGGSTDGTLDLLAKYQERYPERVRFISEPDEGVGEAVNKGFRLARGQILGWIDADDIYELDAIAAAVNYFKQNPDSYFVFGGCNMINESGQIIASFIIKDFDLREALHNWHHTVFCATFYKKQVIEKIGMLNTLGNDLDFWIRVHNVYKMHRIDKVLANWRLHTEGISLGKGKSESKTRKERLRQDCRLCIKYTRNIFAPRCLRYYVAVLSPLVELMRPFVGRWYPSIGRRLRLDYYPFTQVESEKKDSR